MKTKLSSSNVLLPLVAHATWAGKPIHYRPGSGRCWRAKRVRDAIEKEGKTIEQIRAIPGILHTTLGNLLRYGYIHVQGAVDLKASDARR